MQALKISVENAPVTGLNNLKGKLTCKLFVGLTEHLEEYCIVAACYLNINFKNTIIIDPELALTVTKLETIPVGRHASGRQETASIRMYRNLGSSTQPTQPANQQTTDIQQSQVASMVSSIRVRIPNATQPTQLQDCGKRDCFEAEMQRGTTGLGGRAYA